MADGTDAFEGDADGRFERLAWRFVVRGGLQVAALGRDLVAGNLPGQQRATVVVRWRPEGLGRLPDLLKRARAGGVNVVLAGGPPSAGDELARAIPTFTGAGISAWHVGDDGATRRVAGKGDGPVPELLAGPDEPPDWPLFWETARAREAAAAAGAKALQEGLAGRRPVATVALLVVFAVVYVLEAIYGATDYAPAAVRMGALVRDRVLAGEVWRLASCTFLHGGIVHLAFNGLVTWSLGSMLERVLGTARFCLLYAVSALAGSLLSLFFLKGYSVGASGALWGLMTAQAVLSFRGTGILPERVLAGMRQGSMQNLALNVMNSFRPGVDWAAHAGGGIAGGLLALAGLVTVGLPRWAARTEGEPEPDRVPLLAKVGGAVGMALLGAGLVVGVAAGKVWELSAPPAFTTVDVGGWSVDVPEALPRQPDGGTGEQVFGDLLADPVVVALVTSTFPERVPPDQLDGAYTELATQLGKIEDGFTTKTAMHRVDRDGQAILEGRFVSEGGLHLTRTAVLRPDGVARVDVIAWSDAPGSWGDVAARVAASARPAAGISSP